MGLFDKKTEAEKQRKASTRMAALKGVTAAAIA